MTRGQRLGRRAAAFRGHPSDDDVRLVHFQELLHGFVDFRVDITRVVPHAERALEDANPALTDHDTVEAPNLQGGPVSSGFIAAGLNDNRFEHPPNLGSPGAKARGGRTAGGGLSIRHYPAAPIRENRE